MNCSGAKAVVYERVTSVIRDRMDHLRKDQEKPVSTQVHIEQIRN